MTLKDIDYGNFDYSLTILSQGWLRVDVNVTYLNCVEMNIESIDDNVFNTKHFSNLWMLALQNSPITYISNGAFNGLPRLYLLIFRSLLLKEISVDFLKPVQMHLKMFQMKNPSTSFLKLDHIFGSSNLKLILADVNNGMVNNITDSTFTGLINVSRLILRNNRIDNIGTRSISLEILELLDLSENNLSHLHPDVFVGNPQQNVRVDVRNNPLHCDCELIYFIKTNPKLSFFGECMLSNNEHHESGVQYVNLSSINDVCVDWSPNSIENQSLTTIKCEKINKPSRLEQKEYTQKPNRDVSHLVQVRNGNLVIDTTFLPINFSMIALTEGIVSKKMMNCWKNGDNVPKVIAIQSFIQLNHTYRFCLIKESNPTGNGTISALNCFSYHSFSAEVIHSNHWLLPEEKPYIITVWCVSFAFALIVGLLIAAILAKLYPRRILGPIPVQKQDLSAYLSAEEIAKIRKFRFASILNYFKCLTEFRVKSI